MQNLSEIEYPRWVIDDLARFRRAILRMGRTDKDFSGMRGPNSAKLGEDIGRASQHCTFVSEFGYLAAFWNAGVSKLSYVEHDAKFCTFWPPPPVKIKGELGEISILLTFYLRTNLRNTFDVHPLRGCWGRWIDKKESRFISKAYGLSTYRLGYVNWLVDYVFEALLLSKANKDLLYCCQ